MRQLTNALSGLNHWWRYLTLFLVSLAGGLIFKVVVRKFVNCMGVMTLNTDSIESNLDMFLAMIPFVVILFIMFLLFKPLHHRNYKTLITGAESVRWGRFFIAALIWGGLAGIYLLCNYVIDPTNFAFHFNADSFLVLSILSLALIPFQASYEEVVFRGYFAQGVGAWTKSRWLVILIPSILFGLMHSFDPDVSKYGFWVMMPQYILFGLMFGLVTVLDDGIELAMGAHAANNIFISIVITAKGSSFQPSSLFTQQITNPTIDLFVLMLMGLAFVAFLSYRYKWNYSILKQKIVPDKIELA